MTKFSDVFKVISVKDPYFGGVCDGVTLDTVPFQNAVNSLTSGGTVIVPGPLLFSSITWPENIPIRIKGLGCDYTCTKGSYLKTNLASGVPFALSGNIHGVCFEDIGILGNATADGAFTYSGNYGFDWFFKNVKIRGFSKNGIYAVDLVDASHITMLNTWITGITNGTCFRVRSNTINTGVFNILGSVFGVDYDSKYGFEFGELGNALNTVNFWSTASNSESCGTINGGRLINIDGAHLECNKAAGTMLTIAGGLNINILKTMFGGNSACVTGINIPGTNYTNTVIIYWNQFTNIDAAGNCIVIANEANIVNDSVEIGTNITSGTSPTLISGNAAKYQRPSFA